MTPCWAAVNSLTTCESLSLITSSLDRGLAPSTLPPPTMGSTYFSCFGKRASYIQVNAVNASTPGTLTLNIQPHASYSATWTTLNEVDLSETTTGNTYVMTTSCSNTPNSFCY